ncbi:FecR family protein [Methylorubrum sp. POS3]|uniref:FecR family protein n=1 Tax=Methylorubrum sp. POS3 TaxID=2998492 RepID=UPI00372A7FA0
MDQHAAGDADEPGQDPIFAEAALWVARLSSADATEADRAAFEAWRSADPAHADAYAELSGWRRTMGLAPPPRSKARRVPKGVALLAAALGLAGLITHELGLFDRLRADAWTGVGGFETTILADGSRLDLNTDTAVALRFTPNERGIELLRGEAVFDVASDRDRPFVVRGAGLIVRAVGTRFYVRLDGAAEIVGVAEGRVEAAIGTDHTMIAAGEAARKGTDNRIALQRSDVEQVTAWRNGRLIAVGKPLTAILAELNRYRRGRILLLDAALGTRRFTGTLNLRDTDDALAVLSASLRLKVTRVTPFLVIITAAS